MDDEYNFTQPIRVASARVDARELIDKLATENGQLRQENALLRQENAQLRQAVDELTNSLALFKEEIQRLRDEIAILKKQKPRPKIAPSILEGAEKKEDPKKPKPKLGRGKHPRKKKKTHLEIHQTQVIQPTAIPEGAVFKGYKPYDVQDIVFKATNTRYLLGRWLLPDGTYVCGELPKGIHGHYGPGLIAYVLNDYYACRITEPLLHAKLCQAGILISEGKLNDFLIHKKEAFHEEKNELLLAGIEADNQIETDDTGGRHKGKNQYTNVIGNQWFSVFTTTESKNRANFFRLLQNCKHEYLINEDTVAYLEGLNAPGCLAGYIALSIGDKFTTLEAWEAFLASRNITQEAQVRLATEAALFASVIENGIPRNLGVHGDDAGQFDAFIRSLCWIHEERHYRKIIPTNEQARVDLDQVRDKIWTVYRALKAYQESPNDAAKQVIENQFDDLFLRLVTSSPTLNHRLRLTHEKKEKLLRVLERPNTPLHNNRSESDARAAVIKRKVSGGTRSDAGKDSRDTFLSLIQTCRKLKINFIAFLKDRVCGLYEIPRLADLIRQRSSQPAQAP